MPLSGAALSNGEEAPRARHTFEVVAAALVELDARSDHEIPHDARDQDLAWRGAGIDARCDVHRQAAKVIAAHFALAGVQTGTELDAERVGRLQDRARAPNGAAQARRTT